jgi:iron complex outermembrane receptor protein
VKHKDFNFGLASLALAAVPAVLQAQAMAGGDSQEVSSQGRLEEIVVTAQKRSENLQSVPISVVALTAETLKATGVSGTEQPPMLTPSLNLVSPSGNLTPFIRGVGTQAAGAGNDSSVATYVDGVYMPSMASTMLDFSDVERIEVLKGPQGTLFGRNTTGGVINIITKDPSQDTQGNVRVGYGNYQTGDVSVFATTGITDKLSTSFSALYRDQMQGYGRDLANGQEVGRQGDLDARSKWRYAASNDTTITASFDFERSNPATASLGNTYPNELAIGGFPNMGSFWDINSGQYQRPEIRQGGASVTLKQGMGDLQFTSISSYRRLESAVYADLDRSPIPILELGLTESDTTVTQEFQLTSSTSGPLQWIVGAFYLNGTSKSDPFSTAGFAFGGPDAYQHLFAAQKTDSYSGFAQGTYDLGAATRLTVGARFTEDHHYLSYQLMGTTGPIPVADPAVPSISEGAPTWRVSLDHNFSSNALGYVSYNRGYRSGSYNLTDASNPPLKPEKLDAYEIGLKSDFLNRRVRVNVAAYDYRFKDIQLVETTFAAQETLNAAAAKIYGADAELTAVASEQLTFHGGFAYTHARYSTFPDAPCTTANPAGGDLTFTCDASGHTMIRTPETTGSIGANYLFPLATGDMNASATYYYNHGWYSDPDNRIRQPAYDLVNATLGWSPTSKGYEIQLWGKNLTNTEYYDHLTESGAGDLSVPAPPRTYGVSFRAFFH